jgi:hypothetical protein
MRRDSQHQLCQVFLILFGKVADDAEIVEAQPAIGEQEHINVVRQVDGCYSNHEQQPSRARLFCIGSVTTS